MNVVVTGAAGRVGRSVLADLKEAGRYHVTELESLATGLIGNLPAFSIARAQDTLGYAPRHSWRDA